MKNQGKQVYLAGPVRGLPDWGFPAFHEAAGKLRIKGYAVFSPAENETKLGFNYTTGEYLGRERSQREVMRDCLSWICEYADIVVLLPGWESSLGATAEMQAARALGIAVMTLEDALA